MYKGKRCKSTKNIWLMASVVMILAVAIGGTVAYIATSAGPVENTFTLGQVPITVVEDFNGNVKNDVKIKNMGDVDAYIRATVIANWVDSQGNIYGEKPVKCTCEAGSTDCTHDYTITYPTDTCWTEEGGYYYYTSDVAPNELTGVLFTDCSEVAGKAPEGYTLSVEILAQSIQADGKNASGQTPVELAWGEAAANAVGAN